MPVPRRRLCAARLIRGGTCEGSGPHSEGVTRSSRRRSSISPPPSAVEVGTDPHRTRVRRHLETPMRRRQERAGSARAPHRDARGAAPVRERDSQKEITKDVVRSGRTEATRCFRQGGPSRVPHRQLSGGEPGREQTLEQSPGRQGDPRQEEGRDRQSRLPKGKSLQVQDPGNQGRLSGRQFEKPGATFPRARPLCPPGRTSLSSELGSSGWPPPWSSVELPEWRVIVVEKEQAIALHQTGRNSCRALKASTTRPARSRHGSARRPASEEYCERKRSRTTSAES